jgi:replication factor A1
VNTINSSKTNKDFSKRDLTIADDTQTSVKLTIWGNTAQSFNTPVESIIAFKGVKVSDFGGRSLSLLSSGSMTVDPDIDEAHKLRGWYTAVGQNATFNTHNIGGDSGGGYKQNYKVIADILNDEQVIAGDTAAYFNVKASIIYISQKTLAYPACSTPGCNKKVIEEQPGEYLCEKCDKRFPEPNWRYIVSFNVADHTGTMWLNSFDDAGQLIFGMPAKDMMEKKTKDETENTTELSNVILNATCKTYNFAIRAKMDTYNEQPK